MFPVHCRHIILATPYLEYAELAEVSTGSSGLVLYFLLSKAGECLWKGSIVKKEEKELKESMVSGFVWITNQLIYNIVKSS